MQCQIQVVFVFFQIQAGWQLVILAARIYEKCFSHHCALVPQTITAEWDGAIPRRENSSACMPSNVLTCMQVGKKRKTDAESSTALVWGAYYYTEFTHHKTIYSDTFRQSYKQNWENERSHSDAVKMKFSICINMHHSIINLWRGSWDPFILNLLFFFFFCDCIMDMRDTVLIVTKHIRFQTDTQPTSTTPTPCYSTKGQWAAKAIIWYSEPWDS